MKDEPANVQGGLAAAIFIVGALTGILALFFKGWALVGAVAVCGSLVWLSQLWARRNRQATRGKQKLAAASVLLMFGTGTLVAAVLFDDKDLPSTGLDANASAYWNLSHPGGIRNVDQNFVVRQTGHSTGWIAAWQWTEAGTKGGGFLGLQRDGQRLDGPTDDIVIFSLFQANRARGHHCGKLNQRERVYSCRIPYSIQTGHMYRLRLRRERKDKQGWWWRAWIKDETTGRQTLVGAIRVPLNDRIISNYVNYTEYFGKAVSRQSQIPRSVIDYLRPRGNQQPAGVYQAVGAFADKHVGHGTRGSVQPVRLGSNAAVRIDMGG